MSEEPRDRNKLIELLGGSVDDEEPTDKQEQKESNESENKDTAHNSENEEPRKSPLSKVKGFFSKVGASEGRERKKLKFSFGLGKKKTNEDSKGEEGFSFGNLMGKGNRFYDGLNKKNKTYIKIAIVVVGGLILFWMAGNILSNRGRSHKVTVHQLKIPRVATIKKNQAVKKQKKMPSRERNVQTGKHGVSTVEKKPQAKANNRLAHQTQSPIPSEKPPIAQGAQSKNNLALERFNQLVNKTQSAIIKTTQQQERAIFDIFKLEPEQEYKLSRLIRIAQKQDQLLKYELEVLKKKIEMEKMIKEVNPGSESSIAKKIQSLQRVIEELRGEIRNIKTRAKKEQHIRVAGSSVHTSTNTSTIYNELRNISVVAIGNFANRSFAVVKIGNTKIKVRIGQHITPHIVLSGVNSNGVLLSASGIKNKLFVPLTPSIGGNIEYQSVDLKNGVKATVSSNKNSSTFSTSQTTPVVIATTPPPQVSYKPSLPPPNGVTYNGGVR